MQDSKLPFDGNSPLILSVKAGMVLVSELLIEKGADINVVNQVNEFTDALC